MSDDIPKRIRRAVKDGRLPNMRDPRHLGYVPPAAGFAHARFVGYFELGIHEDEFGDKQRERERVYLMFELSGPNHMATVENGRTMPVRIPVSETLDLSYGSSFRGLFDAMDAACGGGATHIAEMLGKPFIVEVFHFTGRDNQTIYATLMGPTGYNVIGPAMFDRESGKMLVVDVAQPTMAIKAFVWGIATASDWHNIYIHGEYPEQRDVDGTLLAPARSANYIQERIASAKNWKGHPLASVVKPGPDPDEPMPAPGQRLTGAALKAWQDENWRRLKATLAESLQKYPKEPPRKRSRRPRKSP
ncbi:hypothetical protein [Burkholderia ambifaria]|uniref:hypothetical protein n=1 Tax=Burkholderia ambifaria TaxID=152480 RepID=UPI00158D3D84|nr:hypothetical protein [Burkholderia ambifaria]